MRVVGRDRRTSVLATVTGVAVAVAGVLLFTRFGLPPTPGDGRPKAAAATASASTAKPGVRGPGIPPAPGGSQNAPPDLNPSGPTANLTRVANALRVSSSSIQVAVFVAAGLNLTARVDISALFGVQGQRVTQTYDNARGNVLVGTYPERNGERRFEEVIVSLLELDANGNGTPHAVRLRAEVKPLYDVTLSPLTFTLTSDCDEAGDNEPRIAWRNPDNTTGHASFSVPYGEPYTIAAFGKTFAGAAQEPNAWGLPTFSFREDDPDPFGFSKPLRPPPAFSEYLLPGTTTRTVKKLIVAQNDSFCQANIQYTITYQLRLYR